METCYIDWSTWSRFLRTVTSVYFKILARQGIRGKVGSNFLVSESSMCWNNTGINFEWLYLLWELIQYRMLFLEMSLHQCTLMMYKYPLLIVIWSYFLRDFKALLIASPGGWRVMDLHFHGAKLWPCNSINKECISCYQNYDWETK